MAIIKNPIVRIKPQFFMYGPNSKLVMTPCAEDYLKCVLTTSIRIHVALIKDEFITKRENSQYICMNSLIWQDAGDGTLLKKVIDNSPFLYFSKGPHVFDREKTGLAFLNDATTQYMMLLLFLCFQVVGRSPQYVWIDMPQWSFLVKTSQRS